MIRTAFSTVACPQWTLDRVAPAAARYGFAGVELRSFGEGGDPQGAFACDPGMTARAKVRSIFHEAGVAIAGVASGCRFDSQVFPPVLGDLLPAAQAPVRAGKHMVEVASGVGAEYLRVFAFQIPRRERRGTAIRRISERLAKVCDHARNRDLRVVIENGADFARASDLMEIIERVNSPLLRACYDLQAAVGAGDDVIAGVRLLGARLLVARVRDERDGAPCALGQGSLPVREFVTAVDANATEWGVDPWVVVNWDRAWLPQLAAADEALPQAAAALAAWRAPGSHSSPLGVKPGRSPQSAAPAMMLG